MSNWRIPQGSDDAIKWPVTLVGGGDLTDGSARAQARSEIPSEVVLYEWSTEDGSAVIDSEGITLLFPGEVTAEWAWRDAVYGLEYVDADGNPHRIDQGQLVIDPEVVR